MIKMTPPSSNRKHQGAGHRKRLRERFIQSGLDGFLDYEIVELLLTLGTPLRDCKQMAKDAIQKFRGLCGVLDASLDELQQIKGIGPSNAIGLKLFQAVAARYAKEKVVSENLLNSPQLIYEFLKEKLAKEKEEHFAILYLDIRNNLILHEVSIGTLNASLIHPREVFKKAIQANAAQVIIAHNHPSGNPTPSQDDIATTKRLVEASKILGISLTDHLIVCTNKFISLKEQNLL